MKHINRTIFEREANNFGWEAIKQTQLDAMDGMTVDQKKDYIKDNPVWNQLQHIMLRLSNNKCWYSEAPIGNGDFEVDHFRPKSRSKQKVDYADPKSKSIILKQNGYWWLAYEWDNYRLSGALANKRRRDRLKDCNDAHGKGDYFPLDCDDIGRIANDEENTNCEIPILLDPLKQEDVSLLTFDSNGEAISAGEDEYEHNRVFQTIYYYHLDLEQLNKERLAAWKDCEREILEIKEHIDSAPDRRARSMLVDSCLRRLLDYVRNPERSYTSAMKACISVYSELDGFVWLKRFRNTVLVG